MNKYFKIGDLLESNSRYIRFWPGLSVVINRYTIDSSHIMMDVYNIHKQQFVKEMWAKNDGEVFTLIARNNQ